MTENSVHNGVSSSIDTNGTSYLRTPSNGHMAMEVNESNLSVSSNGDIDNSEKLALIEELLQTMRDNYERMPAHLLQYELAKAKAMSVVKFT